MSRNMPRENIPASEGRSLELNPNPDPGFLFLATATGILSEGDGTRNRPDHGHAIIMRADEANQIRWVLGQARSN